MGNDTSTSGSEGTSEVVSENEFDRDEIEAIASELHEMGNRLSRNHAIDGRVAESMFDKSKRLYGAVPHQLIAHYEEAGRDGQ